MELKYTSATLTKIKKAFQIYLSEETIEDVKCDADFDSFLKTFIIKATQELLAMKAGDRIIRHPKNWKEALKERWLPRWAKKRFPIIYKEYDVLVVFPDLLRKFPVPPELRFHNFYMAFAEPGSILPKDEQ